MKYKILFVGEQWFGSDARALSFALRRAGNLMCEVDPIHFFPRAKSLPGRALNRLAARIFASAFNQQILDDDLRICPDLVVVFKGASVSPSTLQRLRDRGRTLVQFYPDVSLFTHGATIPESIAKYHFFFTTKCFGIDDLRNLGVANPLLVNHGFDPDVHRPMAVEGRCDELASDVCFIGTWSPKKERYLSALATAAPDIDLKIWGNQWNNISPGPLCKYVKGFPILGDFYTAAIQKAKVNLALLSEQRDGSSSGDMVTARTFQIPAAGGLMLHERTDESLAHFREDIDACYFGDPDEMITKVKFLLANPMIREAVRASGEMRSRECHSVDNRAHQMLEMISRSS